MLFLPGWASSLFSAAKPSMDVHAFVHALGVKKRQKQSKTFGQNLRE